MSPGTRSLSRNSPPLRFLLRRLLRGKRIVDGVDELGVDANEAFGEGCIHADGAEAIGIAVKFDEDAGGNLALTVAAAAGRGWFVRCSGLVRYGDGLLGKTSISRPCWRRRGRKLRMA